MHVGAIDIDAVAPNDADSTECDEYQPTWFWRAQ
jgi:hypothetical protein